MIGVAKVAVVQRDRRSDSPSADTEPGQTISWKMSTSRPLDGLRILLIPGCLELGGTERQAIHLAKYLNDCEGAVVRVVGFSDPGAGTQLCDQLGLAWSRIPIRWGRMRCTRWPLAALRLAWDLRRERPDVLIPSLAFPNTICSLVWRLTGARACIWNQRDEGLGLGGRLTSWAMRSASAFVTNSDTARELLTERYKVAHESVYLVHNGVELPEPIAGRSEWRNRLNLTNDCFVACMVANVTHLKDHATLLRAWRIAVDRLGAASERVSLLLAGRLDDADPIKALAYDLDLGRSVRFLGPVADVAGLLSAVDLGVFSSRSEGCPNGVLECMASGLAVVGTDIPGVREAVGPDGAAILTPIGDAESMAQAILRLASDEPLRREMGNIGQVRIRDHFSVPKMGEAMTHIITQAVAKGRSRRFG